MQVELFEPFSFLFLSFFSTRASPLLPFFLAHCHPAEPDSLTPRPSPVHHPAFLSSRSLPPHASRRAHTPSCSHACAPVAMSLPCARVTAILAPLQPYRRPDQRMRAHAARPTVTRCTATLSPRTTSSRALSVRLVAELSSYLSRGSLHIYLLSLLRTPPSPFLHFATIAEIEFELCFRPSPSPTRTATLVSCSPLLRQSVFPVTQLTPPHSISPSTHRSLPSTSSSPTTSATTTNVIFPLVYLDSIPFARSILKPSTLFHRP